MDPELEVLQDIEDAIDYAVRRYGKKTHPTANDIINRFITEKLGRERDDHIYCLMAVEVMSRVKAAGWKPPDPRVKPRKH